MDGFTSKVKFSGKIDSKGRVTIPSEIRNKLGLENGDRVPLVLQSSKVIRKEFNSKQKALNFISDLEGVESFSFDGKVLKVVVSE